MVHFVGFYFKKLCFFLSSIYLTLFSLFIDVLHIFASFYYTTSPLQDYKYNLRNRT